MSSADVVPEESIPALPRALTAEFVGTFVLVFTGCGAIVINTLQDGVITHVGIAMTFGLVVLAMIYSVGEVSGAHINPAVTIGFWAAGRLPARRVPPYVAVQCLAACIASLTLFLLFPEARQSTAQGMTLPEGSWGQSFILEILLTTILMFVILCVSTGAKEKGITAGIVVGAVIALEALFAGPISGASMNPARSLGPALTSGSLPLMLIYTPAPILGAVLAIGPYRLMHPPRTAATTD